jgi:hypothetical protein
VKASRLWFSVLVLVGAVTLPASLLAYKEHEAGKVVDSGTFGIFINGKRVGSETFHIEQGREKSVATAELKVEGAGQQATQTTQLELAPNGDLLRYEWKSVTPEKSQVVVEQSNEFLVEHVLPGGNDKPMDVPFLVPHSTLVLDDNSFVQREILLWRYLATCTPAPGEKGCRLAKTDFGVLVPHQHLSMKVTLEYKGREKVQIRGSEQELDHFDLRYEDGTTWSLFVDPAYKVMRMVIDADKTEIVRD